VYRGRVTRIEVSRRIDSPISRVWPALADLGSHVTWMKDAESLVFTGDKESGAGATMEVATRVGPFRTNDVIEVTDWHEGRSITVAHRGLVRGVGLLSLDDQGTATRITWAEDLVFPWWLGGPITAWLARPVLVRIWRGNLDRFAASLSDP
jgi:uncharacterized protein YndB with AHSA1/START domain